MRGIEERREGRLGSSLRTVAVALAGLVAATACVPAAAAGQTGHETTRIADGVYQFRYETHNTLFVVTGDGVIAFDPLNEEAAVAYARAIREVAPDAGLRYLVYSHHHADHATGAPILFRELGDDAPIVGHRLTHEKLAGAGDPNRPPPDVTFREEMTLRVGDRSLELHYLGPSHSDNLIVGLLPEQDVAFAVDFVSNDAVGYRELSSTHFPGQFRAMQRLQELEYERIVFGHGPPGDRSSVDRQIDYYRTLRDSVRAAVERGWSEDRAAREIELPRFRDWRGYGDWFELNVRGVYRWLASGEGG